jgi:GTP 3',8-cyclase
VREQAAEILFPQPARRVPAWAPAPTMPTDSFNREIDYLRISLTDRCNLRCVYCMPLDGLRFVPGPELLTAAEIEQVARAAVAVGFRKFRLTGGEPTLRADVIEVVRRIAAVPGVRDLGLTTNAILMAKLARPLREAGLMRVNVHLDSLNPATVERQMRWGRFDDIWRGIAACEEAGFRPIKLNAVVAAGYNEGDVADLARLTRERDWHVRFIELMPLGGGECAAISIQRYVSNIETRRRIEAELGPMTEAEAGSGSDEARNYRLSGARGVVGFISPVSDPYCGTCNRMRLTADGKFHLCLLNDDELDVRGAIRSGAGLERIGEILLRAVHDKPTGHHLLEGRSTRDRSMYQLGG